MTRLPLCLLVTFLSGVVTLAAVPAPPANLQVTVTGATVVLSWTAPPGVVLGYRLEAGNRAWLE